jgi:hypothetical protein
MIRGEKKEFKKYVSILRDVAISSGTNPLWAHVTNF